MKSKKRHTQRLKQIPGESITLVTVLMPMWTHVHRTCLSTIYPVWQCAAAAATCVCKPSPCCFGFVKELVMCSASPKCQASRNGRLQRAWDHFDVVFNLPMPRKKTQNEYQTKKANYTQEKLPPYSHHASWRGAHNWYWVCVQVCLCKDPATSTWRWNMLLQNRYCKNISICNCKTLLTRSRLQSSYAIPRHHD